MSSAKGERLAEKAEDPSGVVSSARTELETERYRRGAVQDARGFGMHFRFAGVTLETRSRARHSVRDAVAIAKLFVEDAIPPKPPGTFLDWNDKCATGVKNRP